MALADALSSIVAGAEAEGITDQQVRDKRKVIIFSYLGDTVEHLATQVRAAVEADDRLAAYRDPIATASGPDKRGRAQTIAGHRSLRPPHRRRPACGGPVRPAHRHRCAPRRR